MILALRLFGIAKKGDSVEEYVAFGVGIVLALTCIIFLEKVEKERIKV